MLCHLILIKHFAEKMILHTKDLPSFEEKDQLVSHAIN